MNYKVSFLGTLLICVSNSFLLAQDTLLLSPMEIELLPDTIIVTSISSSHPHVSIMFPRYRPERPGITKTSFTVQPNFLYLETGFGYLNENSFGQYYSGNLEMRTGVTKKLETAFELNSFVETDISREDVEYNLNVNFKYHLFGSNYLPPRWDKYYNFTLSSGLGVGSATSPDNRLLFSFLVLGDFSPFYEDVSFGINAGYTQHPFISSDLGFLSSFQFKPDWFFTYLLIDNQINMMLNYTYFNSNDSELRDHILEISLAFIHIRGWQLDLNCATKINNPTSFIRFGFTKEFWKP